jgi:uncharacterized protein with NAD-binding domain and iron-sulfur cluster
MREKVVIVGGGVAGLTAAHELIERGFDVELFERRNYYGGKAASVRVGEQKLPGEHGFRFYPGWYRHLPDTMKRIPYRRKGRRKNAESVFDNLVTVEFDLLTWFDREPLNVLMHFPQNMGQAKELISMVSRMRTFGLAPGELAFFFRKLVEFAATSELRRNEVYDQISWWDFLEAGSKSTAYRDLIIACTRNMVAAKADQASAYTIGMLAIRTMLDGLSMVDRVLNGPTTETWIEPWREYLSGRGVCFRSDLELSSIQFVPGERKIATITLTDLVVQAIDRLLWRLKMIWPAAIPDEVRESDDVPPQRAPGVTKRRTAREEESTGIAIPAEPTSSPAIIAQLKLDCQSALVLGRWLLTEVEPSRFRSADTGAVRALVGCLEKIEGAVQNDQLPDDNDKDSLQIFRAGYRSLIAMRSDGGRNKEISVDGDYFVFALPVEQMAYYVNRSATMTHHDPSLRRIVKLAEFTDWMAGIQFFLREPFDAVKGHVVCMDSEWGLTAIEETQFWCDIEELPKDVKSIISVDIASWDCKGRYCQKEAFNCTDDEIAKEVWCTLKASLNRDTKSQWLRDDMLRQSSQLTRDVNYYLDASIVDLYDRKKQALYEKARSVRFSTEELVNRQKASGEETQTPLIWGERLRYNVEPLLVNRAGAQELRPDARTGIPNMFLASDYVRTNTDLACMEGANEAARRAVNAVLEAAGSTAEPCRIWSFSIPEEVVERMMALSQLGDAPAAVSGFFRTAGRFAGSLLGQASEAAGSLIAGRRKGT